jgi:hypothetical protein
MTRQRSFKRLVRARMVKTGESYTAARAVLLAAAEEPAGTPRPVLVAPDEAIRARTGRGWEEWFDLLDEWGADALPHREIAKLVARELGIEPLVWAAQAVTTSYERARGLRAVGQRADGFAANASKTMAVPAQRVFDAFTDSAQRAHWLDDDLLRERTTIAPRSARFDWGDDGSRVLVVIDAKSATKSTVTVDHTRLTGADTAEKMKAHWRSALANLATRLEAGALDG